MRSLEAFEPDSLSLSLSLFPQSLSPSSALPPVGTGGSGRKAPRARARCTIMDSGLDSEQTATVRRYSVPLRAPRQQEQRGYVSVGANMCTTHAPQRTGVAMAHGRQGALARDGHWLYFRPRGRPRAEHIFGGIRSHALSESGLVGGRQEGDIF